MAHAGTIAYIERKLGVRLWVPQHLLGHGDHILGPRPNQYLGAGTWPTGKLVDGAPPEAELAKRIAWRLRSAMEAQYLTVDDASENFGVSEAAIQDLLTGDSWPDLPTIQRLERGLDTALWIQEQDPTQ